MARVTARQEEIPGTESQERNDELHALGLEIKDLETQRKALTIKEKTKRQEAIGFLKALGKTSYHVDGVELYIEENEKLKVHLDSDETED